ncbi:hypothetical protein C9I94_12690 [Photobacterium swingsii]|uniref:Uncharacterized protein n=2 Tax=Photobacterium swingsii TaxID=680026 RepID=A0A2T3P6J1_9GAMM|nr:hypothetical protein C9I94_12690 [Photobacterium swingsii]
MKTRDMFLMTKEHQEFEQWVNFKSKRMRIWLSQYFEKNGISNPDLLQFISTEKDPTKDHLLEQSAKYFTPLKDQLIRYQDLKKMKDSWHQFERRKNKDNKDITITLNRDTYEKLKYIKKTLKLKNISQSIESLIDNSAFKREISRLENKIKSLDNQVSRLKQK